MIQLTRLLCFSIALHIATLGFTYPLDGDSHTGITRLEGYRLVQAGKVRGLKLVKGANLNLEQINLRLQEKKNLTIPSIDKQFQKDILAWLGKNKDRREDRKDTRCTGSQLRMRNSQRDIF